MGNFLLVISPEEFQPEADQLFEHGLIAARSGKDQTASHVVRHPGLRIALFPRRNGSGASMVTDPATGSWLFAAGTWIHRHHRNESDLLRQYLDAGPSVLSRELEGFFVLVIGDAAKKETVLVTDLVGSCHAFLRSWPHAVAISGSSFLLAALGDSSVDPVAFQEFLSTGVIYEDRTLFQDVRKLPPASVLTFADGRLQTSRRYWTMSDVALESRDGPEAIHALGDSLSAVVRGIGQRFTQPVCDLTGGYDSRALVAGLVTAGVSFATTVSGSPDSQDVIVSRKLAQMLQLPHQHIQAKPIQSFDQISEAFTFTDGEYDLVDFARILAVHRILSKQFTISLNGSFGEVARGYWWELLYPHAGARQALDAKKLARLRYAGHGFDPSLTAAADRLDLVDHFAGIIERTNAGLTGLTNTAQMDHAYLMMRMQRWQGRIASGTNQLWPVLSPFLARSVLERMLEAKVALRRRSLLIREMLLRYQPRLAEYPLEHGYPAVPVTWRTVHRFWPLPLDLGRRAMNKLARKAGWHRQVQGEPPYNVRARLALWKDERVRRLLDPAEMRLSNLLAHPPLIRFLEQSRLEGFAFTDQWCRVLTLEHTLRVTEKTKAEIAAASAGSRSTP